MKMKHLALLIVSLVLFTNCYAQKEKKKDKKSKGQVELASPPQVVETVEEAAPEVTEECLINISLFNESAKNKLYADAYKPWLAAYKACPNANRAIYSRGREILHWKLGQSKDATEYKSYFDMLMDMYNSRIKYFGDDERYPTAWILGLKGLDYITFAKDDELKRSAYGWLEASVDGMGERTELEVLRQFVIVSTIIYRADPSNHGEKYIADYIKASTILDQKSKDTDIERAKLSMQIKEGLDVSFAQSGAADCDILDGIFKIKVSENLTNLDYLNSIMSIYRRARCTKSEVYFTGAVAAHKIQPTAESANGCAEMSYLKKEFSKAINFYEEATKLSTDNLEKADYQYKIAQIYYGELDSYTKAREFALKSLEYNPKNGIPYLLIGTMYAKSRGIYDDAVLAKTVYWVAVDKFNKAKQVDPSSADDANKLIRTYSEYFPTKDDIFFQPSLQAGKSFFVGGWIGESTICR